jgi:hypothetical protein
MLTLEEQVIPPGTGETVSLDVCYSDPAWVQPDFDSRWGDEAIRQHLGYDEAITRKIYEHGIYSVGEMYTWATIAGFDWGKAPPGCGYSYDLVYVLAGYEPIEVVTRLGVTQVRVVRRDIGLFAVNVPSVQLVDATQTHIFVDEDYQPIVRCVPYGYCEWNDGTAPNYHNGGWY